MTAPGKDYIARPPKKRPLSLFNYTLDSNAGTEEEEENMQPQDLSMKSRRESTTMPRPATPAPPQPTHGALTFPQSSGTTATPTSPLGTPRHPSDVSALLGLVGGSISIATNISSTTNISINSNSIANISNNGSHNNNSYNSPVTTNSGFSSNSNNSFTSSNTSFMSNAGLRLISEVAAACGRPTVLRAPGSSPSTHTSPYAPPTPRDPLRNVLRERGVGGVRSWHYHPYLPLGMYGLPSPLPPVRTPTSSHHMSSPATHARAGSVSPPGETGSSSSESSPEVQQEGRSPRLACPDCGRRYATMAGLAKHRQFHCLKDAGRSFGCKHCDKVYTSLGALKMHIRTHTLPCKCQLCGKAFSRPWLLQGHIRTHTGEKPFQCPQCDRCFADRSNLRAHLQTHTDVKKYACRTCPKTFSRMSLLVKHEDHGCPGARPSRPLVLAPNPSVSL